jgi:DNA-directed RNA polymerase subunit RPC12/RpoP
MAGKKIKLEEEAISEILIADTILGIKKVFRLESRNNKHWPEKSSTQLRCRLCSSRGQRKGTMYKCARCDVGLRAVPCLAEYHTKVNL